MNTITGTTSVNTVADNIGSAVVDNSDYTSDQVFYNFEQFDYTQYDTTFYIYPADISRETLLKDLYKNIVEWHITVAYKEEKKAVLDEDTFSSTALMYLLTQINLKFPNISVLALETRPEYTDFAELEFLYRALQESDTPTKLELAIGFEAFDEKVRNDVFQKGLSLDIFEELVKRMAPFGLGPRMAESLTMMEKPGSHTQKRTDFPPIGSIPCWRIKTGTSGSEPGKAYPFWKKRP